MGHGLENVSEEDLVGAAVARARERLSFTWSLDPCLGPMRPTERPMLVLISTLLLLVLPGLALAQHLGWLRHRRARWTTFGLFGLLVLWALPFEGVDFQQIKTFNLFLALATALLLLLRYHGVPWIRDPRNERLSLLALAVLAFFNYCNYFSFHGARTFVHLHDVCHYYLGSKYYAELGYRNLYTAMLRAESDAFESRFKALEVRDLSTYEQVHIAALLRQSDPVKAAFSPERWHDFKKDVTWFRQALGPLYGKVLLDHGFNPTPVWALLGGSLAQLVPAGSSRGILLLSLLDVGLLTALGWIVGRTFGLRAFLLAAIFFFVTFGANFGWTGGAFLRYPWFFAVTAGFCALARSRYAVAGGLFALATGLRVFPVFFVLPLLGKAFHEFQQHRRIPTDLLRFFTSLAVTGLGLFLLTLLALPKGFDHWTEFRANMSTHLANISPNVVGLTEVLAFRPDSGQVTAEEFQELKDRRQRIRRAQLALIFAPLLGGILWASRRYENHETVLLALPLLYTGLSLAAYYYIFLVLLVLAHRHRPGVLALVFAVEAFPYLLQIFGEDSREGSLFIARGLALVLLYATLALGPGQNRPDLDPSSTPA